MIEGGDSGAAIAIGIPHESLLIEAVKYEGYEMPPNKQLPDDQINILAKWIKLGAPWPKSSAALALRPDGAPVFTDTDKQWWAIKPVVRPELPATQNTTWARNEIDTFVLAAMESEHLAPTTDAEQIVLIRRLYFDLIGLPPTPAEVDAFLADHSDDAWERLVDQLLADPRYGERWARHWLDVVRYADSDGYRADHTRPNAWRYRDYVIQSLNDDKPYDRFMQEQLAGDELFPDDPDALVATGFLRCGIYEYNSRDAVGQIDIMLNEITDTTGAVFLGLGLQCARCHDHKFDPLLQEDYFRLRAFFEPLQFTKQTAATPQQHQQHAAELKAWESKTGDIREKLTKLEAPYYAKAEKAGYIKFPADVQVMYNKPESERSARENQIARFVRRQVEYEFRGVARRFKSKGKEDILALRRKLAKFKKPADLPLARVATDVGSVAPLTVIPKRNKKVEPGIPTIINESTMAIEAEPAFEHSTGRRSALAQWLSQPDNPLSTRVIVNRIWQYHFGRGLAPNGSDFGLLGGPPSHPRLLDWLTTRFVERGWRMKDLHRLIVTSATYRQSTTHTDYESNMAIDPANRYYWRADTRRLDAEQVRDAILAATGQLQPKSGGPGMRPDQYCRSIFTLVKRNSRDPLLDAFDLPLFFSSAQARDTTTTPIQSLLLINSQTMLRHASKLAELASQDGSSSRETVRKLWRLTFGRDASDQEVDQAVAFLDEQTKIVEQNILDATQAKLVNNKVKTGTFPYRTGQSIVFDPEDSKPFTIPHDDRLDAEEFTVEAFFQLGSIYESGAVRTIISKWNGKHSIPGWAIGVTGKGSRRKPQTLVIQIFGAKGKDQIAEEAIFSDQHVAINTPYYCAFTVRMADGKPGEVTFYLKDLSNDDDPISVVSLKHSITGGIKNKLPLSIGRRSSSSGFFDGLIDDIRMSNGVLKETELLVSSERASEQTIGYWQFEPTPGLYDDSTTHNLKIDSGESAEESTTPAMTALVDLCHVLLNSNEFLYVH